MGSHLASILILLKLYDIAESDVVPAHWAGVSLHKSCYQVHMKCNSQTVQDDDMWVVLQLWANLAIHGEAAFLRRQNWPSELLTNETVHVKFMILFEIARTFRPLK